MDQQLYLRLKTTFHEYDFTADDANLYKLFKYARLAGLRGVPFRQFIKHAKAMGVRSRIERVNGDVRRVLSYDSKADEYLKTVFPQFETCPTCQGSGVVDIMNIKKSIDNIK